MTQGGSKTSIHMKDVKPIFYNNGFKNIKHNNPYSCMLATILRAWNKLNTHFINGLI